MFESNLKSPTAAGQVGGTTRTLRSRALLHFAAALFLILAWFGSLELRGLFIPDEGRYAEIPREMLASGDWITPRMNGLKYFEKPPLQYWMTALSFRLFGLDEWTARLPATLLGFLAMLMVGYTAYRIWDVQTGLLAAATLGGSWAYFLAAQYLTLDMTLTACFTFALCSFLLAQNEGGAADRRAWMLSAWSAAALAVLSKGLVGVVLPALALLAYAVLRRERALLRRLHMLAGGVLFLLIAAPWFVAVQERNPEFFHFFFIREHLQRFAESGHHRPGPWWYYAPIMIVGLTPWTPALLKEGVNWLKDRRTPSAGFSPEWFCAVWTGVIVLFFSVSHSKLPAYILPVMPAVALLLARAVQIRGVDSFEWSAWGATLGGIALLGLMPLLPGMARFAALGEEAVRQIPWLYAAAAALLVSGTAALWTFHKRRVFRAAAILVAGTFGFWQMVFGFLHAIDANISSERLIESLTDNRTPFRAGVPFYSVAQFDDSVPFYLGRTVTLVATRGELGPGIDAEPEKAISSLARFEELWRAEQGQAYAILRPDTLAHFLQRGLPMTKITSDKRLVVVGRRAETR